jgi:exfoliative toxin A/B
MPVPVLPTFVGALTLSNVYSGLGYTWVRHLTMWVATVVLLLYVVKIIKFPKTVAGEYKTVVPSSLYAGFFMMTMILGSYYYDYSPTLGRAMVVLAVACHAVHIVVFTVRNLILKRDINTFVPSWFVTYNGIMVSCVIGSAMGITPILKVVLYYGIAVYICLIPFMIWRLATVEVKDAVYHTMAVVLAPCSLCVVSYLNVGGEGLNQTLLYFLYGCVLVSLAFVIIKLPKFFRYSFTPGFAGLTFPMAIGIVATNKMSGYLANQGLESLSAKVGQLAGFQIYLTSMLVGYVLLNFLIMALKIERK